MITDALYITDTDVCKNNVLCHTKKAGDRCANFIECTDYLLFGVIRLRQLFRFFVK